MSHDQNGRVGLPRCEECNAPLSSDDGPRIRDDASDRETRNALCRDCREALSN
jgi:hypothetical protein